MLSFPKLGHICLEYDGDNDIALYRISGFSICPSINVRKSTLAAMKLPQNALCPGTSTVCQRVKLNEEIELLNCLCCRDKVSQ